MGKSGLAIPPSVFEDPRGRERVLETTRSLRARSPLDAHVRAHDIASGGIGSGERALPAHAESITSRRVVAEHQQAVNNFP